MEFRKNLFGCMHCPRGNKCPIYLRPVESLYNDDVLLDCNALLLMYESFQEIGKRMKEQKEKTCGKA